LSDRIDALDAPPPFDPSRVVIVGTSCAGKSTLAARLATALGAPDIELDEIHWGPGWTTDPPHVFRDKVEAAVAAPRWVCSGNYSVVRDLVWSRATALVWIDLPFGRTFARALRRTARRTLTRERVCGDNREPWLGFLDRDWIPYWVVRTWRPRRVELAAWIEAGTFAPLDVVILCSPVEVERFVEVQAESAARFAEVQSGSVARSAQVQSGSAARSARTSTSSARSDAGST